jgi:hypothetical protein
VGRDALRCTVPSVEGFLSVGSRRSLHVLNFVGNSMCRSRTMTDVGRSGDARDMILMRHLPRGRSISLALTTERRC